MIRLPTRIEDVGAAQLRAGGTDLMERRHAGLAPGDVTDLRDLPGLDRVERDATGGCALGARLTLARLAADPQVAAGWSGVTRAAGALATPEIRAVATLGGNLAQHTRCWYYRHPAYTCLKKGGGTCYAREGDHAFHAVFDLSACVSVHASTMACALLTYDALVEVVPGRDGAMRLIPELLGDGRDPRRHHALADGELIVRVHLPPATAGEKTAYWRAISRARAEWPLVEASVRLASDGARVAVGGVAGVPLRLTAVEQALDAGEPFDRAAARATEGARPLPHNAYKVPLLAATVRTTLEMAS